MNDSKIVEHIDNAIKGVCAEKERIALGREDEARAKERHFAKTPEEFSTLKVFWRKLKARWSRRR